MLEVSKSLLGTLMVLGCYGGFRFGTDIGLLCLKRKWLWIPVILLFMIVGYFIFVKGVGKWFVLIN